MSEELGVGIINTDPVFKILDVAGDLSEVAGFLRRAGNIDHYRDWTIHVRKDVRQYTIPEFLMKFDSERNSALKEARAMLRDRNIDGDDVLLALYEEGFKIEKA